MGALDGTAAGELWFSVEESSAAGQVRRAASALAARLGFSEQRVAEVSIAATELATNLKRHAKRGTMLLRTLRHGGAAGVELFAVDSGPGMGDLSVFSADGYSTGGTLGIGIGAAMRLASSFDAHSVPGRGTVIVATFWPGHPAPRALRVGGVARAMNGEIACGDAWAAREEPNGMALFLADGLGHGELAAVASREAVRAFVTHTEPTDASGDLQRVDRALRSTRGAAAAVLKFDRSAGTVDFAGVGNISAWIDDGERRYGLVSTPGIVGSGVKRLRPVSAHLPKEAAIVLHSDGLSPKWDLGAYPGLRTRDPRLVAATLLRDAGVRHDDASVLVA